MQIKNLVEAGATITRISTLSEGDLYKRAVIDGKDTEIHIGRVSAILNNGETIVVSGIEAYTGRYSKTPTVKSVAFQGNEDVTVFPLSDVEADIITRGWFEELEGSIRSHEESITSTRKQITNLHEILRDPKAVLAETTESNK